MEYFIVVTEDGEMRGMTIKGTYTDESVWQTANNAFKNVDEVLPLSYSVRAALQVLEYAAEHRQIPNVLLEKLSHISESARPMELEKASEEEFEIEEEPDAPQTQATEHYVYTELTGGGVGEMPVTKWFIFDPSAPQNPIGPFDGADSAKRGLKLLS